MGSLLEREALAVAEQSLALGDGFEARSVRVVANAAVGNTAEAVRLGESLEGDFPGDGDAQFVLAFAQIRHGQQTAAESVLESFTGAVGRALNPTGAGLTLGNLGRLDEAFEWFARAESDQRAVLAANLRNHTWPHFEVFRADPRFDSLLASFGYSS